MHQTRSQRLTTKAITVIALICMLATNIQPTPAIARGIPTATNESEATPLPDGTPNPPVTTLPSEEPVSTETPLPPTLTPSIILEPTAEMLGSLDFSAAGEGIYFRALVSLHQPHDLARLEEWNIKVLKKFDRYAYVMADKIQLEKLAHSGFDPSEINSLEYMVTVYNALKGAISLSSEELINSSDALMSISGVDTDSDGLTDTEESWWCTDPNDNNSDSALAPSPSNPSDGDEVQAILDGVTAYGPPFALWPQYFPQNLNGNCLDTDKDSVPDNAEEFMIGTQVQGGESTDFDKFDDGQELFGYTYCLNLNGLCAYGDFPPGADGQYISS